MEDRQPPAGPAALAAPDSLESLDRWLAAGWMRGQWAVPEMPVEPLKRLVPHRWAGSDIRHGLGLAADLYRPPDGTVRRTIGLANPGFGELAGMTTLLLTCAVQCVNPGEVAAAHRHTAAAIRFVIEGDPDAWTEVGGERCPMCTGDLILTPNWSAHAHHNASGHPVIWLDALDFPFTRLVNATFFSEGSGTGRPEGSAPATRYAWADARRQVEQAPADPYDGRLWVYGSPGASHTLPTLDCTLQRLEAGERTRSHRHTPCHIYHVVSGRGETRAGDRTLAWGPGDFVVVPGWTWHEHRCQSEEPALLFGLTDRPLLAAFGLAWEQSEGDEAPRPR